jgi:hypothetical protein
LYGKVLCTKTKTRITKRRRTAGKHEITQRKRPKNNKYNWNTFDPTRKLDSITTIPGFPM